MNKITTAIISACGAMCVLVGVIGNASTSGDTDTRRYVVPVECVEEDSCPIDYDGTINRWVVIHP